MDKKFRESMNSIHAETALIDGTKEYINKKRGKRTKTWLVPSIACALVILLVIGGRRVYAMPVSTVSVECSNPVTIGINVFNRVVYTESADGIQSDELNNMHYTEAVEKIMEDEEQREDTRNEIVITVEGDSEQKSEEVAQNLEGMECVEKNCARVRCGNSEGRQQGNGKHRGWE